MWHLINDRAVKCYLPASNDNIQALSVFFQDKINSYYYKSMCVTYCVFFSPQHLLLPTYLIWTWHLYTTGNY